MQADTGPHAMPFIMKNSSGLYELSAQAQEFLTGLNTPLAVVSVAGMYRTGKSYLLNRIILNSSNGFGVGPTVNPCTKGLWLWSDPIRTADDKRMLVVDTEGLGALDEEANHDMKIFCLAVLLSSTFIYNSIGSIDESALQTLSLVLNLVSKLDRDHESAKPAFMWVVRDFALQLVDQYGSAITSKEYLEIALNHDHKDPSKVQLRKGILEAFAERDCFTLVKPMIDETKLQNLDKIPEDQLRPQFITQTMQLRKKITSSLREMRLGGELLRGKEYVSMIKKYVAAINEGGVPNLLSTWQYIQEQRAREVGQQVKQSFSEKVKIRLANKMPMPSLKLQEVLGIVRKEMIEEYMRLSYGNSPQDDILQFTTNTENQLLDLNSKESRATLNEFLKREYQPLGKKLLSSYYTDLDHFMIEVEAYKLAFIEKHSQQIDKVQEAVDSFVEKRIHQCQKYFQRRLRAQLAKAVALRQQVETSLTRQIEEVKQRSEFDRRRQQEQIYALERRCMLMGSEQTKKEEDLKRERKEDSEAIEKYRRRNEELAATVDSLTQQSEGIKKEVNESQREVLRVTKQLEKERALSQQRQEHMSAQMGQIEKRCNNLQGQMSKHEMRHQQEKKELQEQHERQLVNCSKELRELGNSLHAIENNYEQEARLRTRAQGELLQLKRRHLEEVHQLKSLLDQPGRDQGINLELEQLRRELHRTRTLHQECINAVRESQSRSKQCQDQVRQCKMQLQHNDAIHQQRIEFQTLEIAELKTKNAELNRNYQKYIEMRESKNNEQIYQRKLAEAVATHLGELKNAEECYEDKLRELKREIAGTLRAKEETILQLNLERKKWESMEREMKEKYSSVQRMNNELIERMNSTEKDHSALSKQKESYYLRMMRDLQGQVQTAKQRASVEIEESRQKSEEALAILKNYTEMERAQWERRLEEEKERGNRREKAAREEGDRRLADEKLLLEDSIIELQQRLIAIQAECKQQINNTKYEMDGKLQRISNASMEERMELNKKNALLSQELELSKISYENQLDERRRNYEKSMETQKREMISDQEQQARKTKEEMEFLQAKIDNLKKASRKAEEANFLVRAELTKEKAVSNEKEKQMSQRMSELQTKLSEELFHFTRTVEEINQANSRERDMLNAEIERMKELNESIEDNKEFQRSKYEQEISKLTTRCNYQESKVREKAAYCEDLMEKMDVLAKAFHVQGRVAMQKEYEQVAEHLKADCERRVAEKQSAIQADIKNYIDKIYHLQTENKQLKDKNLLFEVKTSSTKDKNEERHNDEMQKLKDYYERKINEYKCIIENEKREVKKLRDNKMLLEQSKMDRSGFNNRSERSSITSELESNQGQQLMESKTININRRYSNLPTSVKKMEKSGRYINIEDCQGVMKYQ